MPVGSGIVESANKLVVEARRKGAGMHWARHHVTPMLALRTVAFNDRWAEAWPQVVAQRGARRGMARRARGEASPMVTEARAAPAAPGAARAVAREMVAPPGGGPAAELAAHLAAEPETPNPTTGPKKPAPDHPWRRGRCGRAARPQPIPDAA